VTFVLQLAALAIAGSSQLLGTVVPIGSVPSSASGPGSVQTVLKFTSTGIAKAEAGCLGAGVGSAEVQGSDACPAQIGSSSASQLGLVEFNILQSTFSVSEPENSAERRITFDAPAPTLDNPTELSLLDAYDTSSTKVITNVFEDMGNEGFGFHLDDLQTLPANLLGAGNLDLYAVGVADEALGANEAGGGGPQTETVPEPATYTAIGLGLLIIACWQRRKK
jgi:hypothetical protein